MFAEDAKSIEEVARIADQTWQRVHDQWNKAFHLSREMRVMSEAVRKLAGKELHKLYDGRSENGRKKLANLALNLEHIPDIDRPDLSVLAQERKVRAGQADARPPEARGSH